MGTRLLLLQYYNQSGIVLPINQLNTTIMKLIYWLFSRKLYIDSDLTFLLEIWAEKRNKINVQLTWANLSFSKWAKCIHDFIHHIQIYFIAFMLILWLLEKLRRKYHKTTPEKN